jgi:hypothetical protein
MPALKRRGDQSYKRCALNAAEMPGMKPLLCLTLLLASCAAQPLAHSYLKVHFDAALPSQRPLLETLRTEYKQWVDLYAGPASESPVAFLRVGEDQLWALRPASRWADISRQQAQDAAATSRVEQNVKTALAQNELQMHSNITEHHNELWRFYAEVSSDGGLFQNLASVRAIVIDEVLPATQDSYEAKLAAKPANAAKRFTFVSVLGTGAYIHLIAEPSALPDVALCVRRREHRAEYLLSLSRPLAQD